ncbi:hypothetical protein C4552_02420 [Candidatus Parcubacteria bacterium]|nr:MAG: hypothetical protein C4552_02420 [Candidatus Parcubacteria bacterium]
MPMQSGMQRRADIRLPAGSSAGGGQAGRAATKAIIIGALAAAVGATFLFAVPLRAQDAPSQGQRDSLRQQIEALEREAAVLDVQIDQAQGEARTLQSQIRTFDAEIRRREIEIQRLALEIREAELDIQVKIAGIDDLTGRIDTNRDLLGRHLQTLDAYERESLIVSFAKNDSLSDFLIALDNMRDLQGQIVQLVSGLRENRELLALQKVELEDYRAEQQQLKAISEQERRGVQAKRTEKDQLLKITKGREAAYQTLLAQRKQDLQALRQQLYYLERTGVSAAEALQYAQLAANRTGIRTAFLLALLEVETGRQFQNGVITVGTNLGTGHWKTDMYDCYVSFGRTSVAEAEKRAFFKIAEGLGLDPDTQMPVSRRPSYGCGGAMGPAQFIASTWLLFSDKVGTITGHKPPNPWNIEDAFTASAVFLSESGAASKTRDGEIRAARTYISGRPNCPASGAARSACIAYANRIQTLAADIERAINP